MEIIKNIGMIIIFPGFLFSIFMAFLLAGYDRKIVAKMQRRKGPKINIAFTDFIKLVGKDTIIPRNSNESIFLLAPIISLVCMSMIPVFIPSMNIFQFDNQLNIIGIILLLLTPTVFTLLGTLASSSPFSTIGSWRMLAKVMSYEFPLVIILLTVAKKAEILFNVNQVYSMETIVQAQRQIGSFIFKMDLIPAVIAFIIILPSMVGAKSFEVAEADTEISGGIYSEYSGIHLGLFRITENLKVYVVIILFISLFLGGIWIDTKIGIINLIVNTLLLLLVVLFISTFVFSIARAVIGRYNNDKIFKFYITVPTILAVLSYILVSIKL